MLIYGIQKKYYFCFNSMSENKTHYTSNDFSLSRANSYSLLLQADVNHFDYAVLQDKQLLQWGTNFSTDELRDPDNLRDILTANYKQVVIGLKADASVLLPRSLYEQANVANTARLLDVKENEKVLIEPFDDANHIIYKVDEALLYAVKDLDNQKLTHADKGWEKVIAANYPTNISLYIHVGHECVSILNYQYSKLRFYNTFSFKNHEELAYFCALVCREIDLEPAKARLYISGDMNNTDGYFTYLKDFFGEVNLNSSTAINLPATVAAHQILGLAALTLCASSEEN